MTITIQLQTAEELQLLQPLLQMMQRANAAIHIQSDVATKIVKLLRKAGFLKGTFVMSEDFNEPLED